MRYLLHILVISFLTSCIASNYAERLDQIEPLNPSGKWFKGKPLYALTQNGISVDARFERVAGLGNGKYRFRITVINNSNSDISINPTDIIAFHSNVEYDESKTPRGKTSRARNPETQIDDLSDRIETSTEQSHLNSFGRTTVELVGAIASIAEDDSKKTDAEIEREMRDDDIRDAKNILEEQQEQNEIAKLKMERAQLEENFLRRHTIEPNEHLSGIIEIPIVDRRQFLTIEIPVTIGSYKQSNTENFQFFYTYSQKVRMRRNYNTISAKK